MKSLFNFFSADRQLYNAITEKDIAKIKESIMAGAKITTHVNNKNAMIIAIESNDTDLIGLLINKGANLNAPVDPTDTRLNIPLANIFKNKHQDIIAYLLNANVLNKIEAIVAAIKYADVSLLVWIFNFEPAVYSQPLKYKQETVMHWRSRAQLYKKTEIVDWLDQQFNLTVQPVEKILADLKALYEAKIPVTPEQLNALHAALELLSDVPSRLDLSS